MGQFWPPSAHLSPKPISCTPSTSTRGPQVSQLAPAYNLPQPLTRGTHLSGSSPSSLGLELEPRMTAYRGSRGALQPPRSMTGGTYTESETALATTVNQDAPRPPPFSLPPLTGSQQSARRGAWRWPSSAQLGGPSGWWLLHVFCLRVGQLTRSPSPMISCRACGRAMCHYRAFGRNELRDLPSLRTSPREL